MHRPKPIWWWSGALALWLAAGAGLLPAAAAPMAAGPALATVQSTGESAHFRFHYDAGKLAPDALSASMRAAEEGYAQCARVFPVGALSRKIDIDLTPSFTGASGFAQPDEYAVSIRVPELDYLGLDLDYVMTHEIAHVFTFAELASRRERAAGTGPWSEGIADWASGRFNETPLADWWGRAFEDAGLWSDPSWLIDGSSRPLDADFVRQRTCTYDQAALFIRYLVGQVGRERFFRFYADYSAAAARYYGARRREGASARGRLRAETASLFRAAYGSEPAVLLARWLDRLQAAEVPQPEAARLTLHQRIYGSLREFETNYSRAERAGTADEGAAAAVREEFRRANESLQEGDLTAAAGHLERARALADPRRGRTTATVAAWTP